MARKFLYFIAVCIVLVIVGFGAVGGFARGFVMVNGLMQQSTTTFSDRIDYVKHLESGSTTTNYAWNNFIREEKLSKCLQKYFIQHC